MSEPWQRPLIRQCKASVQALIDEIEAAGNLALWQEADGKLNDALLVYRNKGQAVPPSTFTFSDGVTRNLTAMAASHAQAQVDDEILDESGEWPAWMGRGENHA